MCLRLAHLLTVGVLLTYAIAAKRQQKRAVALYKGSYRVLLLWPVALVAYQVILEPGIGQFREFESPRVHIRAHS